MDTITMKMIPPRISWAQTNPNHWDANIESEEAVTIQASIHHTMDGAFIASLLMMNPFDHSWEIVHYQESRDFISAVSFIEPKIIRYLGRKRK